MKLRLPLCCLWIIGAVLWYAAVKVYSAPGEVTVKSAVQSDSIMPVAIPDSQSSMGKERGAGEVKKSGRSDCISLNTADAILLDKLPGIGPAMAKRIVEFRLQHGLFKSVNEIDAVRGIGPATLRKLEGLVCL